MFLRRRFTKVFGLWLYVMIFLCIQGCKKCHLLGYYEEVTVTLDGKPHTFEFGGKLGVKLEEEFLIQLLRRIEQKEVVDTNQLILTSMSGGERPLEIAMYGELTYGNNLNLTRYLLLHGADPNKMSWEGSPPINAFLNLDKWIDSAVGYGIFSLLLAAGARVNIPLKHSSKEIFIDELDRNLSSKNKNLKNSYLTKLVAQLLQKNQLRSLDMAFVNYVEKIGLDPALIAQLKSRT